MTDDITHLVERNANNPPPEFVKLLIIYDGDCSFCTAYTKLLRLQQSVGPTELLSARSKDPRIEQFIRQGHDLDKGMLVVSAGQIYAGPYAMQWLAMHAAGEGVFDRLHSAVFKKLWLSRLLYPLLAFARRLWLALQGRTTIAGARQR